MEKNDKNGHTKSGLSAEYRFVHQRLQQHTGRQRFVMPVMLLVFELAFIVLFGLFANYQRDDIMNKNEDVMRIYPMFQDIHVFVILGIGFIMTFLKRYGYGSLGFNLLLSAFVMQWSLLVRGWIEWNVGKGQFMITIREYRIFYIL
jgi:ammonium transporter Rh